MTTLTTEHLILREPNKADFEVFARLWADGEMLKDLPFSPQSREQSWPRFLRLAGSWSMMGYGTWFVFDKAGSFVGLVGFLDGMRGLGEDFDTHRELSYVLDPHFHGAGYATEACNAALRWMDKQDFGAHTVCMIGAGHAASIKVAQKCGYTVFRESQDAHGKVQLMIRKKPVAT